MPLLFQRGIGSEHRAFTPTAIRKLLINALAATGLANAEGEALSFSPHDFRRIFVTDAIMNGLPPHIAQVICGHKNIDTTIGYKAVYPAETIEGPPGVHRPSAGLPPRRGVPDPDGGGVGLLPRPLREAEGVHRHLCTRFGSPCIHEHACVRGPLLRPDPDQRARLAEIRDNLIARITEAEQEGWLGEIEGLQVSLASAEEKLAQLDAAQVRQRQVIDLGMPRFSQIATRISTARGPSR